MCVPPPEDDAMKSYVTVGLSVLAGAALFEAALIPGMLIGGAVVLAPKYLPNLRRGLRPLFGTTVRRRNAPKRPRAQRQDTAAPPARGGTPPGGPGRRGRASRRPRPRLPASGLNRQSPRPSRFGSSSRPWTS